MTSRMEGSLSSECCDDDIVISGMSGRFPESSNVDEFYDNLINHVDMSVEDDRRFPIGFMGIGRFGKLKDIAHFDSEFFGQSPKITEYISPDSRISLELVYEAIVDAGESLTSLQNSRTGVFLSHTLADTYTAYTPDIDNLPPYALTGSIASINANRISNIFNFTGPSVTVDTACSSALFAIDYALRCFKDGVIDTAVVGGLTIQCNQKSFVHFKRFNLLSPDGRCKSFDAGGNGFVKSEGGAMVLLQRRKHCKRSYARVIHCNVNNDGTSSNGFLAPYGRQQYELLKETYKQIGLSPLEVSYVETHGTGTAVGDPEEVRGLTTEGLFTSGRGGPLLIGSVKSNCGHTECSAGMMSLVKVVLSMHYGTIPANLHFTLPNPNIPALLNGTVQVVTENTAYKGGIMAVNSFGLGGSNAHLILGPPDTRNITPSPEGQQTRLFTYGGRTEDGTKAMLELAKRHSSCLELQALLSSSANMDLHKMPFRGFTVLNGGTDIQLVQPVPASRPPVWFVFPGLGCQWADMGRDMMQISDFRDTIERCSRHTLALHGIDLLGFFTTDSRVDSLDKTYPLVVITAVQIALVNLLYKVGIEADGFIGHSNGEVSCGYADGCLSLEQAMTLAYCRAMLFLEGKKVLSEGKMAVVGLTWEECKRRCPPGVFPACHNGIDSVTISGEADGVERLIEELNNEGKFAAEVPSGGIAFHTPNLKKLNSFQEEILQSIFPDPKKRSTKWLSTSVSEDLWESPAALVCSEQYYINNTTSPVYFHEAIMKIPRNAIIIEVSPHGLFTSTIQKSLGSDVVPIVLMQKHHQNNVEFFYSSLGRCYLNGLDLNPMALHADVSFPVPASTPIISSAVSNIWNHSVQWRVPLYTDYMRQSDNLEVRLDISGGGEFEYLADHKLNGQPVLPVAGYLYFAWVALAKKLGTSHHALGVQFENVRFLKQTFLSMDEPTVLKVTVALETRTFQIRNVNGELVAEGNIEKLSSARSNDQTRIMMQCADDVPETSRMSKQDFYTFWRLMGFEHSGAFEGIRGCTVDFSSFSLAWNGNWMLFLDYAIQSLMARKNLGVRATPIRLGFLKVDVNAHPSSEPKMAEPLYLPASVNNEEDCVDCGGVTLQTMTLQQVPRQQGSKFSFDETLFVPYIENFNNEMLKPLKTYAEDCNGFIMCNSSQARSWPQLANVLEEIKSLFPTDTRVKTLDQYLPFEDCGLAALLTSLFKCKKEQEVVPDFFTTIAKTATDRLLTSLSSSNLLKPCLDIIFDNTNESTVSFVEIDGMESRTFLKAVPLLEYEPRWVWSYTISVKDASCINEAAIPGTSHVIWDLDSETPPPGRFSVVLMKNCLHKQSDIEATLIKVSHLLADGGFLMVEEVTVASPISYLLSALENDVVNNEKKRKQRTAFYKDEDLLILFEKNSFELIYKKSNEVTSTLYLLRKKVILLTPPFCIEMDDEDNWIEELKYTLVDLHQLPKDTRVWLTAAQPNNGVIGFLKCLKEEGFGDRVRCAFVSNLQPGSRSPDLTESSEEFNQVRNKDLFINVFRDGHWGTLSLIPREPALGLRDNVIGCDVAGVLANGSRVMAAVTSACSTHVDIEEGIWLPIPDHWSFEEAATVPMAYSVAYYGLHVIGKLRQKLSLLIVGADSIAGQAALNLALHAGCDVAAVVENQDRKSKLVELYPEIQVFTLASDIDVTWSNAFLKNTVQQILEKACQIHTIDMHHLLTSKTTRNQRDEIREYLQAGIISGAVKPLPCVLYDIHGAQEAILDMEAIRHVKKCVIRNCKNNRLKIYLEIPMLVA
ncbi:fatty acid synthase-like [Physella acuta]|uniref:fatty acid synthase-like n=1 Tax=Physella acuta TaxID=109671 RepID=UPI0027DB844D|nr:fatty acid synthase-like [Physella acuta]